MNRGWIRMSSGLYTAGQEPYPVESWMVKMLIQYRFYPDTSGYIRVGWIINIPSGLLPSLAINFIAQVHVVRERAPDRNRL